MVNSSIILLIILTCISCAKSKSSEKKPSVIKYNSLSMRPVVLKKTNNFCERILSHDEEAIFNVQRLLIGRLIAREVDVTNLISFNKLIDSKKIILSEHLIQFERRRIFKATSLGSGQYDIIENIDEVVNSGINNTICPSRTNYPHKSVENVGLIIFNTLYKAFQNLPKPIQEKIRPIKLKLTPKDYIDLEFKNTSGRRIQWNKGYMVDNAFYNPETEEVVFLPQSREAIELGLFGKPLWEVPMVIAHEYGHHIFKSIYSNYKMSNPQSFAKVECFDNRINGKLEKIITNFNRVATRDFIHSSINEGVADLLAKYVLSAEENYIGDINCFTKNREVHIKHFSDSTIKKFNKDNVRRIFSNSTIEVNTCNITNFQDVHIVGAVFAHSLDTILTAYNLNQNEKLNFLIDWIDNLNTHGELNSMEGFAYFERTIGILISMIYDKYGMENQEIVEDYFSFIK